MRDNRGSLFKSVDVNNNKEFDYLESDLINFEAQVGINAIEFIVPQRFENRLWLVSNHFYRTTKLWWFIANVNNMVNPITDCYMGATIIVPNLSTFTNMYINGIKNDDLTDLYKSTIADKF